MISSLKVPTVRARRKAVTAVPRRIFKNAHQYHINSVSVNSDGERFGNIIIIVFFKYFVLARPCWLVFCWHPHYGSLFLSLSLSSLSSLFFFAFSSYLSADDLRINMWNLEITDQSFNIVDIKPGACSLCFPLPRLSQICGHIFSPLSNSDISLSSNLVPLSTPTHREHGGTNGSDYCLVLSSNAM
jgi:hypothetical protein